MLSIWKKPYIVRRYDEQTFVKGHRVSTHTDFVAYLNVQPVTGSVTLPTSQPEGQRTLPNFKAYGGTILKSADQAAGTPADNVWIDGAWYEVKTSDSWRHISLLAHNKTELYLMDKQPSAPDESMLPGKSEESEEGESE